MESKPNRTLELFNELVDRGKAGTKTTPTLQLFVPSPSHDDYKRSWFIRYFARKVNDANAPVLEIDETQFNALQGSLYYLKEELRWKIRGSFVDVGDTNYKTLVEVEFRLPGIVARLPNLHQYWYGE